MASDLFQRQIYKWQTYLMVRLYISISIILYKPQYHEIFIAIIYSFNVGVMKNLQQEANEKKILIRSYNVIYKLINDVKKEINMRLPSVDAEEIIGMREHESQ